MRRSSLGIVAALGALLAAGPAIAQVAERLADVAPPAAALVMPPLPEPAAPATDWLPLRVFGITVIGGLGTAVAVAGLRRLARGARDPRRPLTDREQIDLVSRRWLGGRESIAVVRVGPERFLVGVGSQGMTLLARLGAPEAPPPAPADFAAALTAATALEGADDVAGAIRHARARLARAGAVHA